MKGKTGLYTPAIAGVVSLLRILCEFISKIYSFINFFLSYHYIICIQSKILISCLITALYYMYLE